MGSANRNGCRLSIFNPDTDLALADFSENYLAPALIRRMADDLAVLPMWVAEEPAGVLAASAYNQAFVRQMAEWFSLSVRVVTPPELSEERWQEVCPWGWNPALRKRLIRAGVDEHLLPSSAWLSQYRQLAGRAQALPVLEALQALPGCMGEACCLTSLEACERYWRAQAGRCVFKAPWSGSGKGLLWCYSDFSAAVAGWCQRVLSVQGALIGMPLYNKVYDFAMEFWSDGEGGLQFVGYSWFDTNAKGAYQGNRLAADAVIEQKLADTVPAVDWQGLRTALQQQLQEHFGAYRGYLGVDMMVCRQDGGELAVCPCVEVNLRMNMGVLARLLSNRLLLPGAQGRMVIEAFPSTEALQQADAAQRAASPAVVQGGKLLSGYLPLVPVTPHSRYRAYLEVDGSEKRGSFHGKKSLKNIC